MASVVASRNAKNAYRKVVNDVRDFILAAKLPEKHQYHPLTFDFKTGRRVIFRPM